MILNDSVFHYFFSSACFYSSQTKYHVPLMFSCRPLMTLETVGKLCAKNCFKFEKIHPAYGFVEFHFAVSLPYFCLPVKIF